jgi:hypothetical protein
LRRCLQKTPEAQRRIGRDVTPAQHDLVQAV